MFKEYQFRKLFGGSHKDFLEQPVANTEWLLAIDAIVNKVNNG